MVLRGQQDQMETMVNQDPKDLRDRLDHVVLQGPEGPMEVRGPRDSLVL